MLCQIEQNQCGMLHSYFEMFLYRLTVNLKNKNPFDNYGMTPLHHAAYFGHYNICKLIVDSLKDKNPKISRIQPPYLLGQDYFSQSRCQLFERKEQQVKIFPMGYCESLWVKVLQGYSPSNLKDDPIVRDWNQGPTRAAEFFFKPLTWTNFSFPTL